MELAEHSAEASHPLCIICQQSLPLMQRQTCIVCSARTRKDLDLIDTMYMMLPEQLGRLPSGGAAMMAPGHDDGPPLPGGDALALLGPGSSGRSQVSGVRVAGGLMDDSHGYDEWPGDPQSAAWELARWEDNWRIIRGEPGAKDAANVAGSRVYLSNRLTWAADHHPEFDTFAHDVYRLRSRLERVTGMDDTPERGVPCLDCAATLLRVWTDNGLADEWTCPRCRRAYSHAEHNLAAANHLSNERDSG